jgi:SAM-dependent methyltransferase
VAQVNPLRLIQHMWGFAPTLILDTATRMRLFDYLENGAKTARELASKTGSSLRGITSLLNALVGLEFLKKRKDRYALTPESASFLVSHKPDYHGGLLRHISGQMLPTWLHLSESVRTGEPVTAVNQQDGGAEFFAELVEGIFPMSYRAAQTAGRHLGIGNLTEEASVLDIGAGSGVWGIALAQQSPHLKITAVDWPKVLEVTKKIIERYGFADRLRTAPGDLLEADFGTGHRFATIGHILHSEGRDRSRRLLKKVYDALAPGGSVVIAEFMPNNERTGPANALIFSINMLVHTREGDTFTFREMSEWLRAAGFTNIRLLEAPAPSPLLIATKPKSR